MEEVDCPVEFKNARVLVMLQQYITDVYVSLPMLKRRRLRYTRRVILIVSPYYGFRFESSGVAMNEASVTLQLTAPDLLTDFSSDACEEGGLDVPGRKLKFVYPNFDLALPNIYNVFFSNTTAAEVFDGLMIDFYNHPFYNDGPGVAPDTVEGRKLLNRKLLGGGCGNVSEEPRVENECV